MELHQLDRLLHPHAESHPSDSAMRYHYAHRPVTFVGRHPVAATFFLVAAEALDDSPPEEAEIKDTSTPPAVVSNVLPEHGTSEHSLDNLGVTIPN